jgi:hypothetical protein
MQSCVPSLCCLRVCVCRQWNVFAIDLKVSARAIFFCEGKRKGLGFLTTLDAHATVYLQNEPHKYPDSGHYHDIFKAGA